MRRRISVFILEIILATFFCGISVLASTKKEDIIILYENDVHCAIEGYSKLAAMKKELQETNAHVGVVSGGDYIQGSSLGVISQGEYIVNLMNYVGYDAVTLGNHEFDYRLTRLNELIDKMNTKPVCCNFQKIDEDESYFEPYSIVSYEDVDVAYIGITTPSTITSSSPGQFKDDSGEFIYTFNPSSLYDIVQESIDSAKKEGADYIIAISHIGYDDKGMYENVEDVEDLIRNTDGLDVVLDAHSHSVIESEIITDKGGSDVLISSTGTKFENIGKLTISNGELKTELINTADYEATDAEIDAYIQQIETEYSLLGDRKVAFSEVDLITHDADGNRLVRNAETNLGDLCADAFRYITNADIGYVNGGGIRSDIQAGDITFNDLMNVFPFNNQIVLAEVNGQIIKDMLEMTVMNWPMEDGSFPHVSGLIFSVNTSIPSSVILNEQEEFSGVSGEYRVYNIKILNSETGKYEPVNLEDTYILASQNYFLLEFGSGMTMFKDAKIIQNDGMLDLELLERYIVENLNGVIDEQYQEVVSNITFIDGEIYTHDSIITKWLSITCFVVVFILLVIMYILLKRKKKYRKN